MMTPDDDNHTSALSSWSSCSWTQWIRGLSSGLIAAMLAGPGAACGPAQPSPECSVAGARYDCSCGERTGTALCSPYRQLHGCECSREGLPCNEDGQLSCDYDPELQESTAVIMCVQDTYRRVFECPATGVCSVQTRQSTVQCGGSANPTSYAAAGLPCSDERTAACSFDAAVMLECIQGTWIESRNCPPSECVLSNRSGTWYYGCANGGYSAGDRCEFQAGSGVCSTDLRYILQCSNGRTSIFRDCGSQRCTLTSEGLACL